MSYITNIKYAILIFPLVALLFTIPFILNQYHKYGAISLFKSIIIYLFIFYLICAYFMVILPLPKISEVAQMTTPRTQLIPFSFIIDFIEHTSLKITDVHTYITALKESYFFVPLFNIILTVPFGMFLRYYYKCDLKKTMIYTFLLSLFFELTQLSGLYFIYPRGYRLFDVDDLLLNTCGGMIGYFISLPIIHIVPKIDEINLKTKERGRTVSGFRRTLALSLDLFILILISIIFKDSIYLTIFFQIIYYFLIPVFLNATIGKKFLNIQILDYNNQRNIKRLLFRELLSILIYIMIPSFTCYLILYTNNNYLKEFIGCIIILLFILIYVISFIKYLFTNKAMLYEKISKTKLVSTIK